MAKCTACLKEMGFADKEDRCKIYINDMPTLEVDFKAFHPNLLSNELGVKLPNDPYDLEELILPETITTFPKLSDSSRIAPRRLILHVGRLTLCRHQKDLSRDRISAAL